MDNKLIPQSIEKKLKTEVENICYLLDPIKNKINLEVMDRVIDLSVNIGFEIAKETYLAVINNRLEVISDIKNQCIEKSIEKKGLNKFLSNLLKKDGNINFFFGFCNVIGRDYGKGSPENIDQIKNSVFKIK